MGIETERKFLVANDGWREEAGEGETIRQGYFVADAHRAVRVRLRAGKGSLNVKGPTRGATRSEFEYEIPAEDAVAMLDELVERPLIEKTRYVIEVDGATFEVDEFFGDNAGLVVAEVELDDEGASFPRPPWLGEEVTHDPRYYNAALMKQPFTSW